MLAVGLSYLCGLKTPHVLSLVTFFTRMGRLLLERHVLEGIYNWLEKLYNPSTYRINSKVREIGPLSYKEPLPGAGRTSSMA